MKEMQVPQISSFLYQRFADDVIESSNELDNWKSRYLDSIDERYKGVIRDCDDYLCRTYSDGFNHSPLVQDVSGAVYQWYDTSYFEYLASDLMYYIKDMNHFPDEYIRHKFHDIVFPVVKRARSIIKARKRVAHSNMPTYETAFRCDCGGIILPELEAETGLYYMVCDWCGIQSKAYRSKTLAIDDFRENGWQYEE